jgi:hypothetical protein
MGLNPLRSVAHMFEILLHSVDLKEGEIILMVGASVGP